ncbi:MAG: thioesterase family protein [Anaerolineales bacterium]|jgi:acyl-CoA thioester hydrolase
MISHDHKPMEVQLDLPVRTYDIDFAGVVSNIVYIRWLEDLRLTILETYYPLEKFLSAGLAPTLVETKIRYHKPVRIADKPHARMWISKVSRLKFVFSTEFYVNGELVTNAEQVGCLIDMSSGKPAVMPEALREIYREQLAARSSQ